MTELRVTISGPLSSGKSAALQLIAGHLEALGIDVRTNESYNHDMDSHWTAADTLRKKGSSVSVQTETTYKVHFGGPDEPITDPVVRVLPEGRRAVSVLARLGHQVAGSRDLGFVSITDKLDREGLEAVCREGQKLIGQKGIEAVWIDGDEVLVRKLLSSAEVKQIDAMTQRAGFSMVCTQQVLEGKTDPYEAPLVKSGDGVSVTKDIRPKYERKVTVDQEKAKEASGLDALGYLPQGVPSSRRKTERQTNLGEINRPIPIAFQKMELGKNAAILITIDKSEEPIIPFQPKQFVVEKRTGAKFEIQGIERASWSQSIALTVRRA